MANYRHLSVKTPCLELKMNIFFAFFYLLLVYCIQVNAQVC